MNEQFSQNEFSGEVGKNTINPTLISMQIQALKESLRRLVNQEDGVSGGLSGSDQNDLQTRLDC